MTKNRAATADDLFALLDLMEGNGIPVVVHGGWAVDALTGTSREHRDVDLLAHERDRARLARLLAPHITKRTTHKLKLDYNGALVDLAFYRLNRRGEPVTLGERKMARWHPDMLAGVRAPLLGREIPVVGPCAACAEKVAQEVRSRTDHSQDDMMDKALADMEHLRPLVTPEQLEDVKRYFDVPCTAWDRLLIRLGLR